VISGFCIAVQSGFVILFELFSVCQPVGFRQLSFPLLKTIVTVHHRTWSKQGCTGDTSYV